MVRSSVQSASLRTVSAQFLVIVSGGKWKEIRRKRERLNTKRSPARVHFRNGAPEGFAAFFPRSRDDVRIRPISAKRHCWRTSEADATNDEKTALCPAEALTK